ncbi:PA14 domain-containing protein, partial [Pontibacter toksunensis]
AGPDKTITLPTSSVQLSGSATDSDGTISGYSWSQVSGPNTATFSSTTVASPTVSGLIGGTYTFRLVVTDNGGATASDGMSVQVNAATNTAPVANAGPDKSITLPTNNVQLSGSGTDSDGTISGYSWSQVSGPAATLSGATTATLTAGSLLEGTYVFRLTVQDNGGLTASDDATVTVHPATTTACTASGTILREHWASVSGGSVTDIPLGSAPTSTSQLSLFEALSGLGSNYGARVRGYICPPATGNYTFFIASDDNSELWLSTTDS